MRWWVRCKVCGLMRCQRGLMRVMRSWSIVSVSIIHGDTPGSLVTIEAGVGIIWGRGRVAWLRLRLSPTRRISLGVLGKLGFVEGWNWQLGFFCGLQLMIYNKYNWGFWDAGWGGGCSACDALHISPLDTSVLTALQSLTITKHGSVMQRNSKLFIHNIHFFNFWREYKTKSCYVVVHTTQYTQTAQIRYP